LRRGRRFYQPAPGRPVRRRRERWHTRRMIRSMTPLASRAPQGPAGPLGCELRAVNHRFHAIVFSLPDELRVLEPAMRERIAARVNRGKLDLGFRLRAPEGAGVLELDGAAVDRLADVARELQARFPMLRAEFTGLLQFPGVLRA